jgi:hypothetical protein
MLHQIQHSGIIGLGFLQQMHHLLQHAALMPHAFSYAAFSFSCLPPTRPVASAASSWREGLHLPREYGVGVTVTVAAQCHSTKYMVRYKAMAPVTLCSNLLVARI